MPILVSVNRRSPYRLTSIADGVLFDWNGDGTRKRIAWTERDSDVAFLAMDRDGNGTIDNGKELFSNCTLPGISNGFDALRLFAKRSNGGVERESVSSDDPIFQHLLLWNDANHNGISESWELKRVSDVISDVGLIGEQVAKHDPRGNRFEQRGWIHVRTAPGRNKAQSSAAVRERVRAIWGASLATPR